MGKPKKVVAKSVVAEEAPSVVAPVVVAPESFLVRWRGGEGVFATKGEADFAVSTHVDAHIVPGGKAIERDRFGQIV